MGVDADYKHPIKLNYWNAATHAAADAIVRSEKKKKAHPSGSSLPGHTSGSPQAHHDDSGSSPQAHHDDGGSSPHWQAHHDDSGSSLQSESTSGGSQPLATYPPPQVNPPPRPASPEGHSGGCCSGDNKSCCLQ